MSILDDLMGEHGFAVPKAAYDKLQEHIAARQPVAHPVAVLRFDRGTPGRENEMPHVLSCQRLPDGEYPVYAAPPAQAVELGQFREFIADCAANSNDVHIPTVRSERAIKLLALIDGRDARTGDA